MHLRTFKAKYAKITLRSLLKACVAGTKLVEAKTCSNYGTICSLCCTLLSLGVTFTKLVFLKNGWFLHCFFFFVVIHGFLRSPINTLLFPCEKCRTLFLCVCVCVFFVLMKTIIYIPSFLVFSFCSLFALFSQESSDDWATAWREIRWCPGWLRWARGKNTHIRHPLICLVGINDAKLPTTTGEGRERHP